MEHPFKNQVRAKSEVAEQSFIIFAENGGGAPCSATVTSRNKNLITVDYGEECKPRVETVNLENITLYYGPDWDLPEWEVNALKKLRTQVFDLPCGLGETPVTIYEDDDRKEVALFTVQGVFGGSPVEKVAEDKGWKLEVIDDASFACIKESTIPISDISTFDYEKVTDEFLNEVEDAMGLVEDDGCGVCTSSAFWVGYVDPNEE